MAAFPSSYKPICGTYIPNELLRRTFKTPKYRRKCKKCFRDLWDHLKE